jgi:hypothetical protein
MKELLEKVIRGNRNERVYLCEQEFALFAMYYFAEFFTYTIPGFQWGLYRLLNQFTRGLFAFLLLIMFRESAKTTITKIYIVYCIAYQKKRFINWDSFDKGNAEAALFDIVVWLQTNRKLIADFGQLYFEDPRLAKAHAHMKRINEFVTANRVKVKAYSTQESTRGRIFGKFRPDLYVLDDFETMKTAESPVITSKIVKHIDELKSGLSVDGQIIFLCNFISDTGSVAMLKLEAEANPDAYRVMDVPVWKDGEITWPDKYVATNEEAARMNAQIPNRKEHKVSLEQKKRDLNASGRKVFEAEMENDPEAAGELFFDRARIDRDIATAKVKLPIKTVGGFSIWEEYAAKYRYAGGADTAKGVRRDACTSCFMRFAPADGEKAKVVGTYASNTIKPDDFGDELASHGRIFGECLLAPELNNTGYATLTRLKAKEVGYPVTKIYRQRKDEQVGAKMTQDLGWEANSSNVAAIYYNFRTAYNDGHIEILCPKLLAEMRIFTKGDLEQSSRRVEAPDAVGLTTRHFDLLRAACICWEMRTHALPGKPAGTTRTQKPAESVSEYYGG